MKFTFPPVKPARGSGSNRMDRELETFVDGVMEKQEYRNGIFKNWIETVLQGIVNYRAAPDIRGSYSARGGQ